LPVGFCDPSILVDIGSSDLVVGQSPFSPQVSPQQVEILHRQTAIPIQVARLKGLRVGKRHAYPTQAKGSQQQERVD
jgi:hypothetical protein